MMHGKFPPAGSSDDGSLTAWQRLVGIVQQRKWIVIVILPTLITALYFWVIATPQYESEAHFVVRSTSSGAALPAGAGAALSLLGGGASASPDTSSVSDYLSSHDAVAALRAKYDLVGIYTRPEADIFSRLRSTDPSPERLLSYFRGQASVKLDDTNSITTIRVRTYRPEDSYRLVNAMLELGEQRVNVLNRRAYDSTLALAHRQLADAENAVADAQTALTRFRQGRQNIDPVATGQAQIGVVSGLRATLAQARAQRAAMAGTINPSSPQARAVDSRIAALEAQVASESARLAGSSSAIAANVGDYQGLQLRQQFAAKRYDEAAAAVQRAREQAVKQQLFIVRVVDPNLPVKALYPKGFRVVSTLFVALTIAYACGWLIAAGVREHSA